MEKFPFTTRLHSFTFLLLELGIHFLDIRPTSLAVSQIVHDPRHFVQLKTLIITFLLPYAPERLTVILICPVESLSRSVTLCGSFKVSKSTVIPYGIAISSVRAYLLPIEPELSSTLCETSAFVSSAAENKAMN